MNKILFSLLLLATLSCHTEEKLPSKDNDIQKQEEYDPSDFRESPSNVELAPGASESDAMGSEITD